MVDVLLKARPRTETKRWYPLVLSLLLWPALSMAGQAEEVDNDAEADIELAVEPSSEVENTRVDRTRRYVGQVVANTAKALDDFFDSENHVDEEASTRLKLKHITTLSRKEDSDNDLRVSGRFNLPALSNRVSLVFEGNDDLSQLDPDAELLEDDDPTLEEAFDRPSIGLEYANRRGERLVSLVRAGGLHGQSASNHIDLPSRQVDGAERAGAGAEGDPRA